MDKHDFELIYLFLALEGKVTVREHNLFASLMKHDGYDDSDIKEIGRNTMNIISYAYSNEDREAIIRHEFEKYARGDIKKGNTLHNRTVLWTLINLGFSDSSYSKAEQRLIHLYENRMNIGKSYVLEMESAAKTLLSVQKEIDFLNTSISNASVKIINSELQNTIKIIHEQISILVQLG